MRMLVVLLACIVTGAFAATGCPDKTPGCTEEDETVPDQSPPSAEEEECCQEDTPHCAACKQKKSVTIFCAEDMSYPGCKEICCGEGCSVLCEKADVGHIENTFTCPWRVLNQTHTIWAPVILEADVEKNCSAEEYGYQHNLQCEQCAGLHKPCEDQYMACGGCCGQPWHKYLKLDINTHHTCPEIKQFFKTRNAGKVECKEAPQAPASYDASAHSTQGAVKVDLKDDVQPETVKVLKEGVITTKCKTEVKQLHCTKIPFKLKFECDKCNLGVPKLLKDCCDECVNWIKGLDNDPTLPDYVKGYGFCQGCDATHVYPVDLTTGNKLGWEMEWKYAGDYDEFTEEKADEKMEQFIEDHVCGLLTPECEDTTTSASPTFLQQDNPTYGESQDLTFCLPYGNGCSGGGRRLEAAKDDDPNVTCDQFNMSHYAKSTSSGGHTTDMPSITDMPHTTTEVTATDGAADLSMVAATFLPLLCFLCSSGLRD